MREEVCGCLVHGYVGMWAHVCVCACMHVFVVVVTLVGRCLMFLFRSNLCLHSRFSEALDLMFERKRPLLEVHLQIQDSPMVVGDALLMRRQTPVAIAAASQLLFQLLY